MARTRIGSVYDGSIITILDKVEANSLLQVVASYLQIAVQGTISALEMGDDSTTLNSQALEVTL